ESIPGSRTDLINQRKINISAGNNVQREKNDSNNAGNGTDSAKRMPDRMRPGIPTEPAKACASLSYSCSCSRSCGIVLEHEQEHVRVRNQREFTVFHTFTARNSSAGNTRVHFPVV